MRILKYAVLFIVLLVALAAAGGYAVWWTALPKTDGRISLPGLSAPVEIVRDTWGVPHIFAQNDKDLFFAQGYCQAQDRLFQMDFVRRVGQGRLSEILGPDLLETDYFLRVLSVMWPEERVLREMSPRERAYVEAYTAGVNAFIRTNRWTLPLEFRILGYTPRPWKITDWAYVVLYMGWDLNTGWQGDLTLMKIAAKVGQEMADEAVPVYPGGGPTIVPARTAALWKGLAAAAPSLEPLKEGLPHLAGPPGGSNAWVLSGKKTTTGRPILCNDPHLGLSVPSVWYEVHLSGGGIDAAGVTLPGVPGIVIGNNRDIAWGFTNVMLDDMDFYIERTNPDNPDQYRYKDRWETMRTVKTLIRVKGADPVIKTIRITRHGPLINEVKPGLDQALSMRWTINDGLGWFKGLLSMIRGRDWNDFTEGLSHIVGPAQNIVYADRKGNIGYYTTGRIPLRANPGDGALPMPGWTGEHEWRGYVPFRENPHLFNPECGYIVEANNKTAPDDYPYYISRYFVAKYRAQRIKDLIEGRNTLSPADNRSIQNDIYSLAAQEILPLVMAAYAGRTDAAPAVSRALGVLKTWDFETGPNSVPAAIFFSLQQRLFENIFQDEMGEELFQEYLRFAVAVSKGFELIMAEGGSKWFDDIRTADVRETRDDIIRRSLPQAMADLTSRFGEDMSAWRWGDLKPHRSNHLVFADVKYLRDVFNIGPMPIGGGKHTVAPAGYRFDKPYVSSHGASLRQIIDFSNRDNDVRVITTGCSGQVGSRFFDNQGRLWRKGEYHPIIMDREKVDRNAHGTLTLVPEPQGG